MKFKKSICKSTKTALDDRLKSGSLKTEQTGLIKREQPMNKYLTIEDVSSLLQVAKSWIYERTRSNQIPFIKLGKYLRFDRIEIENWMSQNSSTSKNSNKRRL